MNLQITGRHFEVTDAIRDFINDKFQRLERHFDHITQTHVILDVQKDNHIAEAKVNVAGGEIFAENHASDMYAAIDGLIDKLDRQVVKHKEKLTDHHATASKFNQTVDLGQEAAE